MHIFVCVFLLLSRLLSEVHGVTNGGLLSWRAIDGGNQIQVEAWISFSGTSCSPDTFPTYTWTGCSGCPTSLTGSSSSGRCISSDVEDDWSILYIRHNTSGSSLAPNVELQYREGFLPPLDRVLSADVLIGVRSDTSKINSPPAVALLPVARVQVGCSRTIPIKMYDVDGDKVSCRMATACGSFCSDDPNSFVTLNESSCELLYNGAGSGSETVNIALIIEDYPSSNITVDGASLSSSDRLSFVSLQFTLKIDSSVPNCTAAPVVEATVSSNNLVYLNVGEFYNETLTAEVTSPADSVDKFRATGLVDGMQASTITTISSTVYSSSFSWIASSAYIGANMACYSAKQSSGLESEQYCVAVIVTEAAASATTVVNTTAAAVTTAATEVTTAVPPTSAVATIASSTVADTTAAATIQSISTEAPFNPCNVSNGGCSDTCKWIGDNSSVCECSSSCWQLAADRKTCIRASVITAQVDVVCGSDSIGISVPDCASIGPMAVSGYNPLSNDSIPTQCTSSHNTTHTSFQFGLHECGTARTEYDNSFEFQNSVRLPVSTDSGAIITRSNVWYQVSIVCSYSKFNNLTTGSLYSSGSYLNHQAIPGLGIFKFDFNFYVDSTFSAAYTVEPVQYPLNSMVYFALDASGTSGLKLFTESCHAYPDLPEAENNVSMHYPLIVNGCNQDSTLTSHASPDPMQNRFSIRAFRFLHNVPGVMNDTNAIIRCFVIVCVNDDSASTHCSQGCVTSSSRRKRFIANTDSRRIKRQASDTRNETVFESPAQEVTSIKIHVHSREEPGYLPDWTIPMLVFGTAVGLAALFALFCKCCIVGPICRRRRKSEPAETESKKNSAHDPTRFLSIGNSPLF